MVRAALLGTLLVLALAAAAPADEFDAAKAAFLAAWQSGDHDGAAGALDDFPEGDERTARFLLDAAARSDWWLRGKIVRALAQEDFREKLSETARTGSSWVAKEAAVAALARLESDDDLPALDQTLSDRDWRVRRAAVLAIAGSASRGRFELLLARVGEEKDQRVEVHLLAALEGWTGEAFGADYSKWSSWWKAHEDKELDPKAAAAGKLEFEGLTLDYETVSRVEKEVGVVVLPDYATRPDCFRPHLDFLSEWAQVHYVRLPDPKGLRLQKAADGTAYYPVDSLVGALDRMRDEVRERRVVLVAWGMSGWLAMAYAQSHRSTVAGIVVLSGWPDEDSFLASARRARAQARNKKDTDLEALAAYNLGETHQWSTARTVARLSLLAGDPHDPILYRILPRFWEDYGEFVYIPDVRQRFREGIDTPALFLYGARDAYSGEAEFGRAKKNFPAAYSVSFRQSGQLPFLDEPEAFREALTAFFKRLGLVR